MLLKRLLKNKRGAALVEYGLLVGGIALISAGAVSLFGHKTSDIIGTVAAILPGAHNADNGPITSGHLIETTSAGSGPIGVDFAGIAGTSNIDRLGLNVAGNGASTNGLGGLIVESR
jgi:Flp pilus assembly pilin Flp